MIIEKMFFRNYREKVLVLIKFLVKKIDSVFFREFFIKVYKKNKKQDGVRTVVSAATPAAMTPSASYNFLENFGTKFEYRFVVHYKKNNSSLLAELCDKYGSDKGEIKKTGHPYPWPSHSYTDFYSRLFDHSRFEVKRVFECGLGTTDTSIFANMGVDGKPGASLRVWRDYFPNAQVIGADIDRRVLFEEERIKTFYLDQTDPAVIAEFWNNIGLGDFDFMLDDGYHSYEAGICLFENSVSRLSRDGIYIIEDVGELNLLKFKDYFADKKFQVDFISLLRPNLELSDNSLVVIRRS
jgi:hypothetical protein